MGLDMYLNRYPIARGSVKGVRQTLTPENISAVESWFEYQNYLEEHKEDSCSWEDWSYSAPYLPDEETIEELKPLFKTYYSDWDEEHKHPHLSISENIGYWRKANAIHNWFVNNIQDGIDDCNYHRAVTKLDLMDLLDICKKVYESLNLKQGKVQNGYTYSKSGNKIYNYEEGLVATNTELAKELLPSASGFFFGDTEYDEYYAQDLQDTINIITNVLETTDFNSQVIYYCSSW